MNKQNSKYRWVVLVSVLFAYLIIVTQRTAPGLISNQLMKDFNMTASMIGLITSIQFLAYSCLQIPIGILSDRYGPNFFLIIGTLLNGVGTLIYSIAANEYVLLIARFLVGMGDATIWVNLVLILSIWFKANEFVKLIGFAGMAGSFGFLLATVPFSKWISIAGWRAPFLITGVVLCIAGIMLYFVLVKIPQDKGITESKPKVKAVKKKENTFALLRRITTNRQAWATFFCHFGAVGTYVGFIGTWAVPYGMEVFGMTRSHASQLIMIGLLGAIIGAPLTGWISGRLHSIKRPYVVAHIIIFISWATFLVCNGKPPFSLLVILFFLIGYGNGASALTFAVVRQSFPIEEVGVVSGFANTGGFLSAVLLPSLFGKILDHFQGAPSMIGYHYGFIIPAAFTLLGLIGGMLIIEKRQEVKVKQTV
ncbi:nitrate/nitrite transporter [Neobacillus mesonae]|uniref:MFS transporter n=1 Tax=Neobacillus mesonae TaxID=1193713 RepID=UPI00203D9488|nr:MFS transporter [Neobacillus mesonae]MCM3569516.1 MFS transporter [Neobacillus mesonae]